MCSISSNARTDPIDSPFVLGVSCPSFVDGPGVRSVVTLAGCPLECLWCHHPASRKVAPDPAFDPARCLACGSCARGEECLSRARRPAGETFAAETLAKRILRDRAWLVDRGHGPGGVTVSGGEPLLHASFLSRLGRLLRAEGVHVALETSLALAVPASADLPEGIRSLVAAVDLWLVDLKHPDPALYERFVGVSARERDANLDALASLGAALSPRIELVPGVVDTDAAIDQLASFCARRDFPSIEFIPYNPPPDAVALGLPLEGLSPEGQSRALSRFADARAALTRASR